MGKLFSFFHFISILVNQGLLIAAVYRDAEDARGEYVSSWESGRMLWATRDRDLHPLHRSSSSSSSAAGSRRAMKKILFEFWDQLRLFDVLDAERVFRGLSSQEICRLLLSPWKLKC